jgi:hypothetical protein
MPHPFSQAVFFTAQCPLHVKATSMHFANEMSKHAKLAGGEPAHELAFI